LDHARKIQFSTALYQHDLEKDERQVAEWYNTISSSYDELYAKEQSYKYEMVLEFLREKHFKVLVDIGCGTGTFLEKAREICDHSIGIDLSTRMLKIAKDRRTPNAEYVLASSSSLPLKDNSAAQSPSQQRKLSRIFQCSSLTLRELATKTRYWQSLSSRSLERQSLRPLRRVRD
jgi:SAM-dependent methyltransferase